MGQLSLRRARNGPRNGGHESAGGVGEMARNGGWISGVTAGLAGRMRVWRGEAILAAVAGWRRSGERYGDRFVVGGHRPASPGVGVGVVPSGGTLGVIAAGERRRLDEVGADLGVGRAKWPVATVRTEFWAKPMPVRSFDWCATLDGYGGDASEPIGYGASQGEAVKWLAEALLEREDEATIAAGFSPRRPGPGEG